jgi:hypothetical protein
VTARAGLSSLLMLATATLGCKVLNQGYCVSKSDCHDPTPICGSDSKCTAQNGGSTGSGGMGGAPFSCTSCMGTKPICDLDAGACHACSDSAGCQGLDGGRNVCVTSAADAGAIQGMCVGCLTNTDCQGDTPICDRTSHSCAGCGADADCQSIGAGICVVGDGHCAASTEVVYLDESVSGCSNADGSAAKPYCTFAQATGALTVDRPILVILGGTKEQLSFSPAQPVTVIGRPNTNGDPGSIPATTTTAISISSGTVLIRDLTINFGSSKMASKGIVIGAGAKVTLLRVVVNLGSGLGVDAEMGSTLVMQSCTVEMNSNGGILLNEASFDIEDTTVTGNGPGTVLGTSTLGGILVNNVPPVASPSKIASTTIANNVGPGLTCAAAIAGTDLLAYGNSSGQVADACGVTACPDAGPTCGAQP